MERKWSICCLLGSTSNNMLVKVFKNRIYLLELIAKCIRVSHPCFPWPGAPPGVLSHGSDPWSLWTTMVDNHQYTESVRPWQSRCRVKGGRYSKEIEAHGRVGGNGVFVDSEDVPCWYQLWPLLFILKTPLIVFQMFNDTYNLKYVICISTCTWRHADLDCLYINLYLMVRLAVFLYNSVLDGQTCCVYISTCIWWLDLLCLYISLYLLVRSIATQHLVLVYRRCRTGPHIYGCLISRRVCAVLDDIQCYTTSPDADRCR